MNKNTSNTSSYIFDSNLDPSAFTFTPPKLSHRHHLALQPLATSPATCRNLNKGTTYEGIFKLQGHLLTYYQNIQKTIPEQVLDILYARIKLVQKASKYVIQITRMNTTFELCFDAEEIADFWLECFKGVCVFTSIEDRYMPLRHFDQYPFSSTYVAKSKGNLEIYAIKRFNKERLIESNSNARLFDQIHVMRNLVHPNISQLYEVSETPSALYLVKQYNPNETLEYILKRSNLQFSNFEYQTAQILESILQGLAFLASQGATMRSLNLNNVVIDKQGQVKITDFYFVTKENLSDFIDDQLLFPGFIAPEIFKYNRKIPSTVYDEKCNVFSAGCILFELLFGFPLFFDQDFGQTLYLNKVFNYNIAAKFIIEEINDSSSQINKQGLKLLLKLLDPDYTQRISAKEALSHPYFNILNDKSAQKNNQIFLNLINQARSEAELPPSFFSCSIADMSNELSSEAVERLYATLADKPKAEEKNLKESPSMYQKRKGVQHAVTKDTDNVSSQDSQRIKGMNDTYSYNASIIDDIIGDTPKGTSEGVCFEEDNGELSDSDDETNSSGIQSFLGSHKIRVSIRSPGL